MARTVALAVSILTLAPSAAAAQEYDDPSGRTLTLAGDIRLTASDGERDWLDGGYGKLRFDGTSLGTFDVGPRLVEADVVWKSQLSWTIGGMVSLVAQQGQNHAIDLSEASLSWRRGPHGSFRMSARAGLFWPPVSLEHSGPEWAVTDTVTPSAINSWIGEEVKLGAIEASGAWPVFGGRFHLTGAVFGLNDTSGTLIAFRGWALHDRKATAFGLQPLPPLDAFMQYAQAPATRPVIELDNRPGYYARLGWTGTSGLRVEALHYDNRGDPEAVTPTLQWGWRTTFTNVGAVLPLGASTRLKAQAMWGRTEMGFPMPDRIWVDTRFRSAYLLATQELGSATLSGRVEAFGTDGRGSVLGTASGEDGWAATLAARHPIGAHLTVLAEALHVSSTRGDRVQAGVAPRQDQTTLQLALRLKR